MYAIIEDSGSQMKVAQGDVFEIDVREAEAGSDLTFDRVLMVSNGDGETTLGKPYVDGATVSAKVLDRVKGEKIDVIKFKRRKGYRNKTGHRQQYLKVEVTSINS